MKCPSSKMIGRRSRDELTARACRCGATVRPLLCNVRPLLCNRCFEHALTSLPGIYPMMTGSSGANALELRPQRYVHVMTSCVALERRVVRGISK